MESFANNFAILQGHHEQTTFSGCLGYTLGGEIIKKVKLFMMLWYFIIKKARQQGQSSVRLIQCMLVKNVHRI